MHQRHAATHATVTADLQGVMHVLLNICWPPADIYLSKSKYPKHFQAQYDKNVQSKQ